MCSGGGGDERCVISRLFSVAEDQSDVVGGKTRESFDKAKADLGMDTSSYEEYRAKLGKTARGFPPLETITSATVTTTTTTTAATQTRYRR